MLVLFFLLKMIQQNYRLYVSLLLSKYYKTVTSMKSHGAFVAYVLVVLLPICYICTERAGMCY